MAITISDISKEAGVSTATVSRMMNKSGYVSDTSREKIEAAIKKLKYTPNAAAISLSRKVSKVIGVMLPVISNPFFGEVIEGITRIADSEGYTVMLFDTAEAQDRELNALMTLRQQNLCGLIVIPVFDDITQNPEFYSILKQLDIPIVLLDREVEGLEVSGVYCDNVKGAYDLTMALIDEGHTNIAVMAGDQNLKLGRDRLEGYMRALRYSNLQVNANNIYYGEFQRSHARELTMNMLEKNTLPTAIMSCNNVMTEGVLSALSEKKMLEDIQVASYDKIPWAEYVGINIRYLDRNAQAMGEKATELIVSEATGTSNYKAYTKIIEMEVK